MLHALVRHQLVQEIHQFLVLLAYRHLRFFREIRDLADQQMIFLFSDGTNAELPAALDRNAEPAVAQLVEINDVIYIHFQEAAEQFEVSPPTMTGLANR